MAELNQSRGQKIHPRLEEKQARAGSKAGFARGVARDTQGALKRGADEGLQQRAISLVVRIAAFQAVDPGSNPGWRITFSSSLQHRQHALFPHRMRLRSSSSAPSENLALLDPAYN